MFKKILASTILEIPEILETVYEYATKEDKPDYNLIKEQYQSYDYSSKDKES